MNPEAILTRRENQVGKLLAWGAIKKEVADRLCISVHTVENHVRNIFVKTGCRSVNEFSAWYFCKNFNISFDLSPLQKQIVSAALLLLFAFGEVQHSSWEFTRSRRARSRSERVERCRTRRTRELEIEYC